jgi:tetratricopeptide (TPR) repeat protein
MLIMQKEEIFILTNIIKSINNHQEEKAEYLLHHYLENEPTVGLKLLIETFSNRKKENKILKKYLYKLVLKNKKNVFFRIQLIKTLINLNEYDKAMKWCQKTLMIASQKDKVEIYYLLAKIYYILNRPERSIFYLNLCLKIDHTFSLARELKNIINKQLQNESH